VRGRVKGGETEREKENVMLNGMRVRESERKSEREQEICVERIIGENENEIMKTTKTGNENKIFKTLKHSLSHDYD
jgi:hypothetical protein